MTWEKATTTDDRADRPEIRAQIRAAEQRHAEGRGTPIGKSTLPPCDECRTFRTVGIKRNMRLCDQCWKLPPPANEAERVDRQIAAQRNLMAIRRAGR
jgi:hypothetical protein